MVPENLLGIDNEKELARYEEIAGKEAIRKMMQQGTLNSLVPGSIGTLFEIHRLLFKEVYPFAGKVRSVNLAKGSFYFAPVQFLENTLQSINQMSQSTFDEIIEKYVELNIAHPFREGNGRALRIWLDHLLYFQLHRMIDWSLISSDDYFNTMIKSPVHDAELKELLSAALCKDIDNPFLHAKMADASFAYEEFQAYSMKELINSETAADWSEWKQRDEDDA